MYACVSKLVQRAITRVVPRTSRRFSTVAVQHTPTNAAAITERQSLNKQGKWTRWIAAAAGVGLGAGSIYLAAFDEKHLVESAIRFSRSAWTGALVAVDYKWALSAKDPETRAKRMKEVHQRSAQKLLQLCKRQGGVYVKIGQHISSLYYLLPIEYCNTMRELHNRAQTRPFEEIVPVFMEDLKAHPKQLFDEFEEVPIAAASIAQVHRARKGGKTYAVKVQFPNVRRQSTADVFTIDIITRIISKIFPEFKLAWLVREFEDNLPKELDFTHEASNANRIRECFKSDPSCTTPEIYTATKRIIIMEYIDGVSANDVEGIKKLGFEPIQIANIVNRVFTEQVFVHRFVHCDPHAGNLKVRKTSHGPQVVLLDNGLYKEYDSDFGLKYASLWMAILQRDEIKMQELSRDLGVKEYQLFASMLTARTYDSVRSNLYRSLDSTEIDEIQDQAAKRAHEITDILASVPSALILLLKTNDLLRVLNQDLGAPPHRVFAITLKQCQQIVHNNMLASSTLLAA